MILFILTIILLLVLLIVCGTMLVTDTIRAKKFKKELQDRQKKFFENFSKNS